MGSIIADIDGVTQFLKKTLVESGCKGFVVGLSGGIDSSVCAALAKRAIDELYEERTMEEIADGEKSKFVLSTLLLPIGGMGRHADVAEEVAFFCNVPPRVVNLTDAFYAIKNAFNGDEEDNEVNKKWDGNIKARLRMTALYNEANRRNLLVIGTDNLSETETGYFTKHGDGASDVFPLSGFVKREVYALAAVLELPKSALSMEPSAGLWEGQTDEAEMGIPYNFIDNSIEGLHDLNKRTYGQAEYARMREKLRKLHASTEHKRAGPHVYKRA